MFTNSQWARHLFGRSPQSVVDSGDPLRHEESAQTEIYFAGPKSPTALPVDVTGCTGFQDLPDELLENIFRNLEGTSRKNYFAVCGVSRSWRRIGQSLFFASPWNTPHLICHPNQLFCLSPHTPIGSRSGLLKCFVRRERHATAGDLHGRRITLHLGKDPHQPLRARFLLCALQHTRHQTWIYLNGRCEGPPCARLISNLLCTSYTLVLDDSIAATLKQPESLYLENESGLRFWRNSAGEESGMTTHGTSASPRSTDACSTDAHIAGHSHPHPHPHPPASNSSQMLLSLQYKARLKGLMQPRRMDACLPDPCTSPSVPSLLKKQSSASASRPILDHVSSVAVLELPPRSPNSLPGSPSTPENTMSLGPATPTTTTTTTGDVPLIDELTPEVEPSLHPESSGLSTGTPQVNASNGRGSSNKSGLRSLLCGSVGRLLPRSPRTAPEEIVTGPLPVRLHNKSPHWNDGLRCWCLNFRGRVKLASVKNFQLVRDGDVEDKVVMQFGKVDEDAFIMDFNPTEVSTIQAFAMALSTFDGKVML